MIIPADISHQLRHVLRMKSGDRIAVFDNQNHEWIIELSISADQITGVVVNETQPTCEPLTDLTLFFSLTQRVKVEMILQKCTEIGASMFQPFVSQRSLVRGWDESDRKQERWEKIIREASEQSNRGRTPQLLQAVSFDAVLQKRGQFRIPLIAWENENQVRVRDKKSTGEATSVGLIIGPEGGFEEGEIQQAVKRGWIPISLGNRILRMETAAMVGTALVLDHFEQALD